MHSKGSKAERIREIANRYPDARAKIIFAPGMAWRGGMFQRPQQLARALARGGALVYYLQPAGFWPDEFIEIEEKLVLCQAPASSFGVLPGAYVHVMTWNLPQLAGYPSHPVIYDVIDRLEVFEGNLGRMRRNHERFVVEADLVTVTSNALFQEIKEQREDALLCPNGVDFEHFQGGTPSHPPEDLAAVLTQDGPVIGYHGALARWFDYGLVKELASRRPEYTFVLLGMDYDGSLQEEGLLQMPNLHWLGNIPYEDLPGYVRAFDVGLIPFLVNEITQATSPIKLYEYFAAGMPVVSSPLREVRRYEEVFTASGLEEWLARIDQALSARGDPNYLARLRELGRENAWQERAEAILNRLEALDEERALVHAKGVGLSSSPRRGRVGWVLRRVYRMWRLGGFRGVLKALYEKMRGWTRDALPSRLVHIPRALQETFIPEDFSQVTLYREEEDPFPAYQPAVALSEVGSGDRTPVSLIATAYNEGESVDPWMDAILGGSRVPDEIVVVDAGSSDGTQERLQAYLSTCPVPLRILEEPGVNIAQGRNLAIQQANGPVIVTTDFGCRPQGDWLDKITAPFDHRPEMEISGGWSRAVDSQGRETSYPGWPSLEDVSPDEIVPSSRSFAFKKGAWEKVGGYPEWLTQTGEDTYFALELKRFCPHWAFVPPAVVDWVGPDSWVGFLKKGWSWSAGNGELGYNNGLYWQAGQRLLLTLVLVAGSVILIAAGVAQNKTLWILSACLSLLGLLIYFGIQGVSPWQVPAEVSLMAAQVGGFLKGASRKDRVDRRRLRETEGVFIVLAGVPLDDTGGGSRSAQLTLELLRQGYWVVYIHRFPRYESGDSGARIAHPNLFDYGWKAFRWEDFEGKYGSLLENKKMTTLVEMPVPDFLPLIERLQERGVVLYDLIDDWDTSLGGSWYSPVIEREIVHRSQGWMGSAPSLVQRLEGLAEGPVLSLPNAVNQRLFNPDILHERPDDLPGAEKVILYIGALWGEWLDWDLLVEVAHTYKDAAVAAIGDYRGQCQDSPANLHFLGLKPQTALPAYLSCTDVAIIPWKVTPVTRATSPLKVYEYLAMEVPVVAPDLPPLRGLPGVWMAGDREAFIELVGLVDGEPFPAEGVREFIRENSWEARVIALEEYLERLRVNGLARWRVGTLAG